MLAVIITGVSIAITFLCLPIIIIFTGVFTLFLLLGIESCISHLLTSLNNNNNNNIRLVTLAEHTSDHGKQTNSSTK